MLTIFRQLTEQLLDPDQLIRKRYETFKGLLNSDRESHHLLAEIEKIYYEGKAVDINRLRILYGDFSASVEAMIDSLYDLAPGQYKNLSDYYKKIDFYARFALAPPKLDESPPYVLSLENRFDNDLQVGGKGMNLAELKQHLKLPVPRGFIISTSGWNCFTSENQLRETIDRELAEVDISSMSSLQSASERLTRMITESPLPKQLSEEIMSGVEAVQGKAGSLFAVRSSAVAEDSELSFAGQYLSLLNVQSGDVPKAFCQVLASKYSPEAILYRIINGLDDEAVPMAVLVLEMVDGQTGGVAVTRRKNDKLTVQVHGVSGLGDKLMTGEVIPEVAEFTIAEGQESRIENYPVGSAALPEEANLLKLGRYAEIIDQHYNRPQEIEWSCDKNGELYLLQARPLSPPVSRDGEQFGEHDLPSLLKLFTCGESGAPGIGCGRIVRLSEGGKLPDVVDGSILVCEITPPTLVALLPKLAGVIAASGSPADHFSSVAREFGVPVLLQVGEELEKLTENEPVLLHADTCTVFTGQVAEPERFRVKKQLSDKSSVGRIQKMMIDFTSPLSLLDPTKDNFTPEKCRSLHDIIRFVHEKGVQAMFLHNPDTFFRKPKTVQLVSDVPLQVFLIDVGNGLGGERKNQKLVGPENIRCEPFAALWKGLSDPGVNWRDRSHFDWASYDSVALAGGVSSKSDAALSSYCLLSDEYVNINMRFGYHFTLIDCLCGESPEENYILIRFAGGGGTATGKDLRLSFISGILEQLGFTCEQTGEMLDIRMMRYDAQTTIHKMERVGNLLGAVRLLDMVLKSEEQVAPMIEQFFAGTYDFSKE